MKCPKCKLIEMLVKEIKENKIIFICPKCKETHEQLIAEIQATE